MDLDLDQQLQILIDQAPQDGTMPQIMAQAIAPVLKTIAQQLEHQEYYVCQSAAGDWLMTTLAHREHHPQETKTVIYCFVNLTLAQQYQGGNLGSGLTAVPLPVTHILFQLFALGQVDSLIFVETQGKRIEIQRRDLQRAIQKQLQGDRPQAKNQWA
ncbi:MAG: hypothetical protein VKJ86_00210 [Synechococcus sp.]|nr:hypothetical protein [Synechococcus sp.]